MIHARNLRSRIPSAELVALCDPHDETLHSSGRELNIDALFTDFRDALKSLELEAVVVVTPTYLHREIACFAATLGKHVFLEKPMALSVSECQAINAAVQGAGVKLQIGFMRRFDERFIQARRMLDSGELGRIMIIKSTGRGPGGPGAWMYDLRKSNGIIAEVNSHDLDSLRWFSGKEFRRVFAQGRNFKSPDARKDWPEFYDNVAAQFEMDGGAIGLVDGTCPAHYGYDARVEILCEKGVIFVGAADQSGFSYITMDGQSVGRAVRSWRILFKEAYLAEMEHFVQCIVDGRPPGVGGEDGLRAVQAAVAVNESIRLGQPVAISSTPL
jgi:scyllo-inositol 2-dehydrogenase (NAD+)